MGNDVVRQFLPGNEWVYYKIYAGPKSSDYLLSEVLPSINKKMLDMKTIKQWFFIRYSDPDFHLRIRYNIAHYDYFLEIVKTLNPILKNLIRDFTIHRVQIDTYNREIERYGVETIHFCETIFYFDSNMVTDFLAMIEGETGEIYRWLFALKSIEFLLNDFKFSIIEKLTTLEGLKSSFAREFNINRELKSQLDYKFRENRQTIEGFIYDEIEMEGLHLINQILLERSKNNINPCSQILSKCGQNKKDVSFQLILNSIIHMNMNRIFKSKNRTHELVCYDFLYRVYKSKLARGDIR